MTSYPQGYTEMRKQVETELHEWIDGVHTTTDEEAWWCRLCQTGMSGPIAVEVQLSAVTHVLGPDHAAQHVLYGDAS